MNRDLTGISNEPSDLPTFLLKAHAFATVLDAIGMLAVHMAEFACGSAVAAQLWLSMM